MRLGQRFVADGKVLFRLRSIAPLILAPLMFLALIHLARFELRWGEAAEDQWLVFCLIISALGLALRCFTIGYAPRGTSGRGTKRPTAAMLNRVGVYSIVRNPLYLANGIMLFGVTMATATFWFVAVTVLCYWLYIERIVSAEEAYLAEEFGEAYDDWAAETPCFLPRVSRWKAPDQPFSLRLMLRREYPGFIALATAFTLVELISDVFLEGEPFRRWLVTDREWVIFFVTAMAIGLTIRSLKKLHYLDAVGR